MIRSRPDGLKSPRDGRRGVARFSGPTRVCVGPDQVIYVGDQDWKVLRKVLGMRKPQRVFWCSMTDIFGHWVTDAMLDKMYAVMALTPHLTHILLTKRPERAKAYLSQPGLNVVIQNVIDEMESLDEIKHAPFIKEYPLPNASLDYPWVIEAGRLIDERIKARVEDEKILQKYSHALEWIEINAENSDEFFKELPEVVKAMGVEALNAKTA